MSFSETRFLSLNNFNQLYDNIKDIIQNRDSFNIDNSKQYKKILKKLVLSIKNKNLNETNLQKLNNIAINKCVPFLISIIHKENNSLNVYNETKESSIPESFKSQSTIENTESNEDFMKRFSEMEKERDMQIQREMRKNTTTFQDLSRKLGENTNKKNEIQPFQEPLEGASEIGSFFTTLDNTSTSDVLIEENDISNDAFNDISSNNLDYESIKQNIYKNFNEKMADRNTENVENANSKKKLNNKINYSETLSDSNNSINLNNLNNNITKRETLIDNEVVFIVDTGTSDNSYVQNINNKYWSKFICKFNKTIEIDSVSKIYLENITIIGLENLNTQNIYINIDEIKINNYSNNNNLTNIINIPNTSQNGILNLQTSKYIGNIDKSISNLTFTIMNQDFKTIEEGNFVFNGSNMKNRIIMEFKIK